MIAILFSHLVQASMVGIWQVPNGNHVIVPFYHPEKIPVLFLSPTGVHQVKEGVWLEEQNSLHLKMEGLRKLNYDSQTQVLSFIVDKDIIPLRKTGEIIENHFTAGLWKDAHQEDIIPVFSNDGQWVVRYFSHDPPRVYEANWKEQEGGTLDFSGSPPCTLSFDAGKTDKGQIICGDTVNAVERYFRPGPSTIEPPSGRWQNEAHILTIEVLESQFTSVTLEQVTSPTDETSVETSPEPASTEQEITPALFKGSWVESNKIFSFIGESEAYTCTYHALSPNHLFCDNGSERSDWVRIE